MATSAASSQKFRVHERFESRFLQHDRDIIVYLPPSYGDSPSHRYPVCYMHDGQNLFDPSTAFAGRDWQLHRVADDLIESRQIAPLIIVGIHNTGNARMQEYTHVGADGRKGGLARAYGNAIVKELKPLIDREYRTLSAPDHTALGGSSLGGLVSAYLGFRFPQTFGKLIIMSPSVWWAGRDILRHVKKPTPRFQQKVWLDVGTCEGSDPEACVRDVRELRDAFTAKGWRLGHNLIYHEDEGAEHNEVAWGLRMRIVLRSLFAPPVGFVG